MGSDFQLRLGRPAPPVKAQHGTARLTQVDCLCVAGDLAELEACDLWNQEMGEVGSVEN